MLRKPPPPRCGGRIGGDQADLQMIVCKTDDAFMPFAIARLELADGEGVKEFIGDEQHGAFGDSCQRIVPGGGDALALDGAQARAGLDKMDLSGTSKYFCSAQNIVHQCAAAGAQFNEVERGGRTHRLPLGHTPDADQLAEDLRDFGSGDEIKKWIMSVVIVPGAEAHVLVKPHGALGDDQFTDGFVKHGAISAAARRRWRRAAGTGSCPW